MALHFHHFTPKYMLDHELIEEFIKDMFLIYRVGKLELSTSWLAKAVSESSNYSIHSGDVRQFFRSIGLEAASMPKRLRIPVDADYALLDAQGYPEITAYHCEIARPYRLLVQDWLTQKELHLFGNPLAERQTAA